MLIFFELTLRHYNQRDPNLKVLLM